MRVRGGRVPFLDRHVERLVGSCPRANLMPPPADLSDHVEAHALRPPADRILRLEWNGATLVWEDRPWEPVPAVRLALSSVPHPGYSIKATDREAFDRADVEARGRDAEPLLVTEAGWIAETSRFAIAWFEGDALRLPDLGLDILPSIGRIRLMELAEERGIPVEVGRWRSQVLGGRAVFLVNAVRGIVPVSALDGDPVPRDPRLAALSDAFWPSA